MDALEINRKKTRLSTGGGRGPTSYSSRNRGAQNLNFRNSQERYAGPVENSTERDTAQSDNPGVESRRSLSPDPQANSHSQGCKGAGDESACDVIPLDPMQSSPHNEEQGGRFECGGQRICQCQPAVWHPADLAEEP